MFLFIRVWVGQGCRATDWEAVLVIAEWTVEGYRTLAEAMLKPWCVPTAAKLNIHQGRRSHVGWHSDDKPLFGERWETKLIVSVSFWDPGALQLEGQLLSKQ